jgi:hypothetical protein
LFAFCPNPLTGGLGVNNGGWRLGSQPGLLQDCTRK